MPLSFVEASAFGTALIGGQFDFLPLRDEPFPARSSVLRLNDIVVQFATTPGHVARGGLAPGVAVLVLNLHAPQCPARVNGAEVGAADAVLAIGGAEITSYNPRRLDWAALSLPLAVVEEMAQGAVAQVRVHGAVSLLALRPDRVARLIDVLTAARRLAEDLAMLRDSPQTAESLAMSLRDEIAAALTDQAEVRPRPRAAGEALRLIAAAEAFMHADISRPVYTAALCAALGVSARKLHDAFHAIVEISPHTYLKRRRLMLVHRALLSAENSACLVKSVALRHGFWHLGNFAHDYRAMFGAMPCETLAAARFRGRIPQDGHTRVARAAESGYSSVETRRGTGRIVSPAAN